MYNLFLVYIVRTSYLSQCVILGKHVVLYDDEISSWEAIDLSAQPVLTALISSPPSCPSIIPVPPLSPVSLSLHPACSSSSTPPSITIPPPTAPAPVPVPVNHIHVPAVITENIISSKDLPPSAPDRTQAKDLSSSVPNRTQRDLSPSAPDRTKVSLGKPPLSIPVDSELKVIPKPDKSDNGSRKEKGIDEKLKVSEKGKERQATRDTPHIPMRREEVEKKNEGKLKRMEKEEFGNRKDKKKISTENISHLAVSGGRVSTAPTLAIIDPMILTALPSLEKRIKKRQREPEHDNDNDTYSPSSEYRPVTSKVSKSYRR